MKITRLILLGVLACATGCMGPVQPFNWGKWTSSDSIRSRPPYPVISQITNAYLGSVDIDIRFYSGVRYLLNGDDEPAVTAGYIVLTNGTTRDTFITSEHDIVFHSGTGYGHDTIFFLSAHAHATGLSLNTTYNLHAVVAGVNTTDTSFYETGDFAPWVQGPPLPFPGGPILKAFGDSTGPYYIVDSANWETNYDVWHYDLSTRSWSYAGSWSNSGVEVIPLNGKFYSTDYDGIHYFDPKQGGSFFIQNGPEYGNASVFAAIDQNNFYYGGLYGFSGYGHHFWTYSVKYDRWKQEADMPFTPNPYDIASICVAGKLYVYNALYGNDTVWCYDPNQQSWTFYAPPESPRFGPIVVGLAPAGIYFKTFEPDGTTAIRCYDPVTRLWQFIVTLPPVQASLNVYSYDAIVSAGNHFFVALSADWGEPRTDFWMYTP